MLVNSFFAFIGFSLSIFLYIYFQLKKKYSISNRYWRKIIYIFFSGIMISKILFLITSKKVEFSLIGGYVFLGLIIPLILYWLSLKGKKDFVWLNVVCISITFAHSFGRIGCYFSNCCYGFFLGVPVQLFESLVLF